MSEGPPTFAAITAAVTAAGLTVRGGFHPTPGDRVPEADDGVACGTLVLIGNVGPAMWAAFDRARQAEPDVQNAPEPLENWVSGVIGALGEDLGARPFYPFGVPPYQPFQRWAQRAEAVFLSPIGILIHPDYGLWHAYRGALAFASEIELPSPDERPSPCEICADKPCLSTCPVSAFTPGNYDVPACLAHITAEAGADCRTGSCLARRACPIGREHTYAPDQSAFHMAAFIRVQSERAE